MSPSRPAVVLLALSLLVAAAPLDAGAVAASRGGGNVAAVGADRSELDFGPASGGRLPVPDASGPRGSARIAAIYPNPFRDGDRGESVTVFLPEPGNWSLTDGEAVVPLRNGTGRVAVGTDTAPIRNRTNASVRVVRAPAGFGLSNGGERLTLRQGGRVVDTVVYENAPEGERWVANGTPRWRPRGYTPRDPVDLGRPDATAFVLPDAPEVPLETLRSADRHVLLAGYTFASERAATALVAAAGRGVDVRLLVEAEPVGGLSRREATLLDRLVAAGVEVRVLAGPDERFAYHHPKYAVVDGRALVLTENWKPSGTGGRSNRGWGVRLDGDRATTELAALFRNDANGTGAVAWASYREGRTFEPSSAANGSFPGGTDPERVAVDRARLLTAPGNAESAVVGVVNRADNRVAVVQPTIGRPDQPMLRACVRAAERGAEVRILLSGAWYTAETNRRLAERLNARADRENLPLTVRVAEPTGRFGKIHAKGVVADDTVVVGSLNWNDNSADENREVAVALRSEAAAEYYLSVFDGDWDGSDGNGGEDGVPIGTLAAVVLAAAAAMAVARRRVNFVGEANESAVGFDVGGANANEDETDGSSESTGR